MGRRLISAWFSWQPPIVTASREGTNGSKISMQDMFVSQRCQNSELIRGDPQVTEIK